jgi:hypothetical protein
MSSNYLPKAIVVVLFIGGFNLELLDKDGKNLLNLTEGVQGLNDKNVKSFNKKRVVVIEYLKCICKCKMQIEVHFLGYIFLANSTSLKAVEHFLMISMQTSVAFCLTKSTIVNLFSKHQKYVCLELIE